MFLIKIISMKFSKIILDITFPRHSSCNNNNIIRVISSLYFDFSNVIYMHIAYNSNKLTPREN